MTESERTTSFRQDFRAFLRDHRPEYREDAAANQSAIWRSAGTRGYIGNRDDLGAPDDAASDRARSRVIAEELVYARMYGFELSLQNDVLIPLIAQFASEEQKQRWLPGMIRGDYRGSLAVTEPEGGSSLAHIRTTATPTKDGFLISGRKHFVSNFSTQNMLILLARVGASPRGLGLFVCTDQSGVTGETLYKAGLTSLNNSTVTLDHVRVPIHGMIGSAAGGLYYFMQVLPRERWIVAVKANAMSTVALVRLEAQSRIRVVGNGSLHGSASFQRDLAEFWVRLLASRALASEASARLGGRVASRYAIAAKLVATRLAVDIAQFAFESWGSDGYLERSEVMNMLLDAEGGLYQAGASEAILLSFADEHALDYGEDYGSFADY